MGIQAPRQRWQPASYNRNGVSLFNRDVTPESSDNEDEDDNYRSRDLVEEDITVNYYVNSIREKNPAADPFAGATADDWFHPGAEEPIRPVEGMKEEPVYEDDHLASLFEDDGVDDFVFGPPTHLVNESRDIEDCRPGQTTRASDSTPPSGNGGGRDPDGAGKPKMPGNANINASPMAFAWMSQQLQPKVTDRGIQGDTRATNGRPSFPSTATTQPIAPTTMDSAPKIRGLRKLEPISSLTPLGAFRFASCKKPAKPGELVPSQIEATPVPEPRRPTRERSQTRSRSDSHDRSWRTSAYSGLDDGWIPEDMGPDAPCPTPGSPTDYNIPFFEGTEPFWANQYQNEDYTNRRSAELLTREEVLEELKKAKSRIWELELNISRAAWELRHMNEELMEIDTAKDTIFRLENTITRLEQARQCDMDHLDLAGEEIRGLKDRRMRDAEQLALAHARIKRLQGGRHNKSRLHLKRPVLTGRAKANAADYARRRRSWEEMKDRFLADMQ
ncbi:hypothetical protein BJX76DRAFT_358075 [Aspergillus varians]